MVVTSENVSAVSTEYAEIARRPLESERCALLVVDIQEKLLPPIFQKEELVRNSKLSDPRGRVCSRFQPS
jgi:hypothetical protein